MSFDDMTFLSWVQVVALLFAGIYFLFKLGQGWLMVNVSLAAVIERSSRAGENDDLAISVTVTKGGNGSVRIHDTKVRVEPTSAGKPMEPKALHGVDRLETTADTPHQRKKPYKVVESWSVTKTRGLYRLPPGESSTWSCHVRVPTGDVCLIDVVVLGLQWPNWVPGQWRCSLVSLPVAPDKASSA